MVARMLEGVEARLNEDYLADKVKWNALAETWSSIKVIVPLQKNIERYNNLCFMF